MPCITTLHSSFLYVNIILLFDTIPRKKIQSYVIGVCNKLVSAHCTVRSTVLTITDEKHKRCVLTVLPVIVLRY